MAKLTEVYSQKCFGGYQKMYSFESKELSSVTKFGVYFPPQCEVRKCPVLFFLAGLTCNESTFITEAGGQQHASKHNLVIVCPDTSPRGCGIEGEEDSYDFGTAAGFYCDATEPKWKKNYRMYSYVTKELPEVLKQNFSDKLDMDRQSIFGHSMGGHGTLTIAMKNPGRFRSVSAFAPVCSASEMAIGQKCLGGYLGANKETWKPYDACELVKHYKGPDMHLLIHQGTADEFLQIGPLYPDRFEKNCKEAGVPLDLKYCEGYDHLYLFISTFVGEHIDHHAKYLNAK